MLKKGPVVVFTTNAERTEYIRQSNSRVIAVRKKIARTKQQEKRKRLRDEKKISEAAEKEKRKRLRDEKKISAAAEKERKRLAFEADQKAREEKCARKLKRARRRKKRLRKEQVAEIMSFDINTYDPEWQQLFQEMEEACLVPDPPKRPEATMQWVPFMQLPNVVDEAKPDGSLTPNMQAVRFRAELEYGSSQWLDGCFELTNEDSFGRPCVQVGDSLVYTDHATEMYLMLVRNIVARVTGVAKLPVDFQYPVFESPALALAADLASDQAVLRELDAIQYDKDIKQKGKYAERVIDLVCERMKRDLNQLDTMFLSIDPTRARSSTMRDRSYLEQTARAGMYNTDYNWRFEAGRPGAPTQFGVTEEHALATFYYLYSAGTQSYDKDIVRDLHGSVSYRVCTSPFAISNSTPFKPSVIRSPRNKGIALMGVSPDTALPCVSNNLRPGVAASFATTNAVYCFEDFKLDGIAPSQARFTCASLNDGARLAIHTALHRTFANIIKHLDPASTWFPASPMFRFISLSFRHGLVLSTPTVSEALLVTHVINIAFVNLEAIVREALTAIMETAANECVGDVTEYFARALGNVYRLYRPETVFNMFRTCFSKQYKQYAFMEAKFMAAQNIAVQRGEQATLAHLRQPLEGARLLDFCKLEYQKLHTEAAASMNGLTGSMLSFTFVIMYASSLGDAHLAFHACQALYTHIFSVRKITDELALSYRPASPRLQRLPSLHRIAFLFSTAFWIAKHRGAMKHAPLSSLPMPSSNYCYCPLAPCPIVHTTNGMAKMLSDCKRYSVVADPLPIPPEMGGGTSFARGFEGQNTAHCHQKVYVTDRIPLHLYSVAKRAAQLLRIEADPIAFPAAPVLRARVPIQRGTHLGVLAGEERLVRVNEAPAPGRLYYHESIPYLWQTPVMDGYMYQLFAGRYGNYLRFVLHAPGGKSTSHGKIPTRGSSARALQQATQHSFEPNCTFRPYIPDTYASWMPHEHCASLCRAVLQAIPRFWMLEATTDIDAGEILVADTTKWFIEFSPPVARSSKKRRSLHNSPVKRTRIKSRAGHQTSIPFFLNASK